MNLKEQIKEIIESIISKYSDYFVKEKDHLLLFDPLEREVIGAHYGHTHMAAAMIIWGDYLSDNNIIEKGYKLLDGFFYHSKEYQKSKEYHWDFNNFALAVLSEYLDNNLNGFTKSSVINKNKPDFLRKFIINQKDSKNPTINWLPMRLYVNYCKKKWTGNNKYDKIMKKIIKNLKKARYNDGFFDDLLPKGNSFNFQYHIYTTAILNFLETQGLSIFNDNKSEKQSINIIDPMGDFNYFGRGTNQIFAWGPGLFLYRYKSDEKTFNKVWDYFYNNIKISIDTFNILLNNDSGKQKNLWWDYHYSSVYFSHLLFWLVLTLILDSENKIKNVYILDNKLDSGVNIIKTSNYQICLFSGRKHYVSEKGPLITNICRNEGEVLFKGPFGPLPPNFGSKNSIPMQTINNYLGAIQEKMVYGNLVVKPIFPEKILINESNNKLNIKFVLKKEYEKIRLNLPVNYRPKKIIAYYNDNVILRLKLIGDLNGPYGLNKIYASNLTNAYNFNLIIE